MNNNEQENAEQNEKGNENNTDELKEPDSLRGVFENVKKINQQAKHNKIQQMSELQKKESEKADRKKENYAKKLNQEHLELIKMKQGIVDESEIFEEKEEPTKYTLSQKISNFFYHNKLTLILGSCFAFIAGFLIYDYAKKDRPDMTIMILINDSILDDTRENTAKIFEQYIEDINENGEIHVTAYYMPVGNDVDDYSMQANSTKLYVLMNDADTLLVMADKESEKYIDPERTLEPLTAWSENENVDSYGFYFSKTDFMKDIEYEKYINVTEDVENTEGTGDTEDTESTENTVDPDNYYIGIRKVKENAKYSEKMQKNYDIAYDALSKFIEQYS